MLAGPNLTSLPLLGQSTGRFEFEGTDGLGHSPVLTLPPELVTGPGLILSLIGEARRGFEEIAQLAENTIEQTGGRALETAETIAEDGEKVRRAAMATSNLLESALQKARAKLAERGVIEGTEEVAELVAKQIQRVLATHRSIPASEELAALADFIVKRAKARGQPLTDAIARAGDAAIQLRAGLRARLQASEAILEPYLTSIGDLEFATDLLTEAVYRVSAKTEHVLGEEATHALATIIAHPKILTQVGTTGEAIAGKIITKVVYREKPGSLDRLFKAFGSRTEGGVRTMAELEGTPALLKAIADASDSGRAYEAIVAAEIFGGEFVDMSVTFAPRIGDLDVLVRRKGVDEWIDVKALKSYDSEAFIKLKNIKEALERTAEEGTVNRHLKRVLMLHPDTKFLDYPHTSYADIESMIKELGFEIRRGPVFP